VAAANGGRVGGVMTIESRLHAAIAARGPLCAGIDPHAELLTAWGCDDNPAR
jgi:orotidine-5'-phosphate decarboxylase